VRTIFFTTLHNLPLVIVCTILGIISGNSERATLAPPTIVLFYSLFLLALLIVRNKKVILFLMLCISLFTGVAITQHHKQQYSKQAQLFNSYTLSVVGTILDKKEYECSQQLIVHVHQFHTTLNRTWHPINAKIIIYTKNHPPLQIGDIIEIPQLSCAPLNTDKLHFMQRYGYSGSSSNVLCIKLHHRPIWHLKNLVHRTKNYLNTQLKQKLNTQTYHLFCSLFLGKHEKCDNLDLHIPFSYWGLNHYLARAGLHLLILLLILNYLLSFIFFGFTTKTLINTGFACGYYILTWNNIPFIRALLVFLGCQSAHIFKIPVRSIHILNLVLLGYVLLNPLDIFFLDFQLTFAITYILLIIGSHAHFSHSQ